MGTLAPLAAAQRRALARLSANGLLEGLYLAGGVAIARHFQHRRSNDLDFSSKHADFVPERLRRRATDTLGAGKVGDP
jgi:hypothetical protein